MKRWLCVLLAVCLLPLAAMADTGEMTFFESRFGFSLWYPEGELSRWTEEWEGAVAECFCPRDDQSGVAMMVCRGSRYSALLWSDYAPVSMDEPEAALDYPFELTAYTDGETMVEQWVVSAADADYVFIIQYETGDYQGWAALFHAVLETLEFPGQPAETASFRLDFFQGGAAGMRFIDVTVDGGADAIVLMPLEEVTEFSLETLDWDLDAWEAQGTPVYTAESIGPGENLRVYCYIPDVLPSLRFSYVDGKGQAQCWYIFQSGRDGSLLLTALDDL